MNMFELTRETALVIGATGVLGGALARGLAKAGANVIVGGRNPEKGAACVNEIVGAGGRARFQLIEADWKDSCARALDDIQKADGCAPSILVNAAGGNDPKATVTDDLPFEAIESTSWDGLMKLNLSTVVNPVQIFGSEMVKAKRGSIINIASVSGHIPLSRVVAYSAAKAAVINLTQFIAREWGQKGVRSNSITPGFFPATQNSKLLFNEDGSPTDRTKRIWAHTPMNRFGKPDELIGAAVFLASEASSFVTGLDLKVDGGFLCQTI